MGELKILPVLFKICSKCEVKRRISEFYVNKASKDGRRPDCRVCQLKYHSDNKENRNIQSRNYYNNNKDVITSNNKIRYAENKIAVNSSRLEYLYGITQDDYNKMFLEQEGQCAVCKKHQAKCKKALGVDHCHKTNVIRGLLCIQCNFMIGNSLDCVETLIAGAEYLRKKVE